MSCHSPCRVSHPPSQAKRKIEESVCVVCVALIISRRREICVSHLIFVLFSAHKLSPLNGCFVLRNKSRRFKFATIIFFPFNNNNHHIYQFKHFWYDIIQTRFYICVCVVWEKSPFDLPFSLLQFFFAFHKFPCRLHTITFLLHFISI